ncbi:MAG: aldo/keto reductase [Proteobacteria bacterium]|nr:aldo/keto reductase [Pseudomonadota bacterium]
MKMKRLGKSELIVSEYCLGTMTFGEQTNERDSFMQMERSLDAGINFFDTAELYPTAPLRGETAGNTEKIIGNWLNKNKHQRKNIVLASKVVGKGYNAIRKGDSINPSGMKKALDDSLKRLKTDYLDLYQLHWPNRGSYHFRKNWEYDPSDQLKPEILNDIELLVDTLYSFKEAGKIRAAGLSNETCWGTLQFVNVTKKYKDFSIASIQNEYSLLCRLFDTDMSELSHNENIPLLAYSPLAGGVLTGKYLNDAVPENSRLSRVPKVFGRVNDRSSMAVSEYIKLSQRFDISPVHLALAFCKQRPFMGSVIFGATTVAQLDSILQGLDQKLGNDVIDEINRINKMYPMTF